MVGGRGIVLNQIPCDGNEVCRPVAGQTMLNDARQRSAGNSAPQIAGWIGEQMRVCDVQDTDRISSVRNATEPPRSLVAIVLRLVRAVLRHADIVGLLIGQLRNLRADALKMQPRDLLVKVFGEHVNLAIVLVGVLP